MKFIACTAALVISAITVYAEMPASGFRAVTGGGSPDGRWLVCVLDSSNVEFVDQLPDTHHHPYLIDLDTMGAVAKFAEISTLGGYHGRPESNVTAKWFSDSKHVVVGWRVGRLNHDFALFGVGDSGSLLPIKLPDPLKREDSLFSQLKPHSNCGRYLESIKQDGEIAVVYHGFWPKEDSFFETEPGKGFDRNRILVVYRKEGENWMIKTVASPGAKTDPDQALEPQR